MGKLKALACTGLALILAGIVGFGYANNPKKIEDKKPSKINQELWDYHNLKWKAYFDLNPKENDPNFVKSYKIAATYFINEDLDSAKTHYQKMALQLKQALSENDPVAKECGATIYAVGPVDFYTSLCRKEKNSSYLDSLDEYVELSKSQINNFTPFIVEFFVYGQAGKIAQIKGDTSSAIFNYNLALKRSQGAKKEINKNIVDGLKEELKKLKKS